MQHRTSTGRDSLRATGPSAQVLDVLEISKRLWRLRTPDVEKALRSKGQPGWQAWKGHDQKAFEEMIKGRHQHCWRNDGQGQARGHEKRARAGIPSRGLLAARLFPHAGFSRLVARWSGSVLRLRNNIYPNLRNTSDRLRFQSDNRHLPGYVLHVLIDRKGRLLGGPA